MAGKLEYQGANKKRTICVEEFEDLRRQVMLEFVEKLRNGLQKGLPGTDIQWIMASSDRMVRDFPRVAGDDARIAAILILLYPVNGSVHTVFMQRPDYNGVHGGQISFPGGKKEPYDKDIIATALREAHEETGVSVSGITVIDKLTPLFIPVSNMVVTPVVAWTEEKPVFSHHAEEVVFLFDAELRRFLDPAIIKVKPMLIRGEQINVKYYDYEGNVIWGATAMMLNELLAIIKENRIIS
jgi:8-oxo-dGTP pyrophosphatase MutT (NUDIX family)